MACGPTEVLPGVRLMGPCCLVECRTQEQKRALGSAVALRARGVHEESYGCDLEVGRGRESERRVVVHQRFAFTENATAQWFSRLCLRRLVPACAGLDPPHCLAQNE
ncbi:hypothetical protein P7K49_000063 [Saguinus oedipus]|uniref:Uncharacterized protein n=1 Tax=Saguinus oedipus TaxID=9490 RepID=A0ABQ9WAP1_SAGOE|nr:hypothetical protein P7K49_000063 [Saguinus oedipus]